MREVILDTETTGIDPASGHRIVEIGCIELVSGVRTGKFFHTYLNPQREVPYEAEAVHGLSTAFLKDKPLFAEKVDEFLEFLGSARLVIHNAAFDMKFVNAELGALGFSALAMERVVDTLLMARKKFPGSPASLDALCKRFNVDLSARTKHGALLDAELLAEVYAELLGGKQVTLALDPYRDNVAMRTGGKEKAFIAPRDFSVSEEEMAAHRQMIRKLKQPMWEAETA